MSEPRDLKVADARSQGWLEGIIDGEGAISLFKVYDRHTRRGYTWRPALQITSTDYVIVKRVKTIVGRGSIQTRARLTKGGKLAHEYKLIGARSVLHILPQISLTAKEKQRVLLLEAAILIREHVSWHPKNDGRLEQIYQAIWQLNGKRGKRRVHGETR